MLTKEKVINLTNIRLYSVVGFLKIVWLLDTLIRNLLQNLLNSIVIIFRSIYPYVLDSDQKLC